LDVAYGAKHTLRADFGDQVRLLAYDLPASSHLAFGPSKLPTIYAQAGETLPVVLYWRVLSDVSADYSVFVHLDGPNGQTFAGADELNPEDIPTSHWPPALYVRNSLTLALDAGLPPIRYTLAVGLYDTESGARLPVAGSGNARDVLPLAYVWLSSPTPGTRLMWTGSPSTGGLMPRWRMATPSSSTPWELMVRWLPNLMRCR
jgi:hypothetical protein